MENNKIETTFNESDRFVTRDLSWDTSYFGEKCGRIDILEKINENDMKSIEGYIEDNVFVTITNGKENSFNNNYIGTKLNAFLSDVNIHLKKNVVIANVTKNENNINICNRTVYSQEMLDLADGVFTNSRFLNDNNISKEKAKGLYREWVKNSFEKEEKYFITYKVKGKIVGFILFSANNNEEIVIELICVSYEHSGNGVGTKIMKRLELYAVENGYSVINVGTQIENINALNFYISYGYKIDDVKYIYHLWNK